MKYFVTGATGFVGGRVARQLLAQGHQVNVLARNPARAQDLAALGAAVYPGDITERESLRAPMAGVDGVFHIAGWYKVGGRDASEGERINVDGTRNVLDVMRELGIPKGVYTSTLAVSSDTRGQLVDESYRYTGPHLSTYNRTKAAAHKLAEAMIRAGLPLVIAQPGMIYGPGDTSQLRTSILQFLQRRLPALPLGTEFCWAHVDDIANAHLLAMEKGRPGETYIIAGPRHSAVEFFSLVGEFSGVPAPRLRLSPPVQRLAARLMGVIEQFVPLPESYSSEYLRSTAGITYVGDNSKARRELGYEPRPLREGLRETVEYELQLLNHQ